MAMLILGLVLFLGIHSTRIFADGWRTSMVARLGAGPWKGLYSVVSIVSFIVLLWGYGMARKEGVMLYAPPVWGKHLAALLVLVAFIVFVSAYVPRNWFRAKLHHPMMLSVKVWAFAHLLANGSLADVVLFGAFLLWAALGFRAARQRDRAANTVYAPGTGTGTAIAVVAGTVAWAVFAFWLHGMLIGVRPFGV